jgi:hypothetical protein
MRRMMERMKRTGGEKDNDDVTTLLSASTQHYTAWTWSMHTFLTIPNITFLSTSGGNIGRYT